jgi:hypothetical protein
MSGTRNLGPETVETHFLMASFPMFWADDGSDEFPRWGRPTCDRKVSCYLPPSKTMCRVSTP